MCFSYGCVFLCFYKFVFIFVGGNPLGQGPKGPMVTPMGPMGSPWGPWAPWAPGPRGFYPPNTNKYKTTSKINNKIQTTDFKFPREGFRNPTFYTFRHERGPDSSSQPINTTVGQDISVRIHWEGSRTSFFCLVGGGVFNKNLP